MRQYYFHDEQIEKGPFLLQELKTQNLSRTTPVWYEGLTEWITAEQVPELNVLLQSPPPFHSERLSVPPPFTVATPTPTYASFEPQKRSYKMPILIAGVVVLGIVGWLMYNNQSQASQLEVQSTQIETQSTQLQQIQQEQQAKEEKKRQINDALTKKNMEYRKNFTNYIGVARHNADISDWGGMESFSIWVANKTDYILDEVEVLVTYMKDNGSVYKTETITYYNVPPSSEIAEVAPGSSRGTAIYTEITKIHSKKMHFCYPINNGNPEDPYFCK